MSELIYLRPEHKLSAAIEDVTLNAFYELQHLEFTEQPIPSEAVNVLLDTPEEIVKRQLKLTYKLSDEELAQACSECEQGVLERYAVK